jgi:hypothetical protein
VRTRAPFGHHETASLDVRVALEGFHDAHVDPPGDGRADDCDEHSVVVTSEQALEPARADLRRGLVAELVRERCERARIG